MEYKLTDYLTSINWSKKKLMDTDDKDWEKKYPQIFKEQSLKREAGIIPDIQDKSQNQNDERNSKNS